MNQMSEKRFQMGRRIDVVSDIYDSQNDKLLILSDVVNLLNEQLSIIRRDEMSIKTMISNMEKLEKENEQLRKEHQEMLEKYLLLRLKIGEVLNDG